ncbi:PRD domain-containing protein [Lactobacillus sp. ESL0677]|uniref:BglG family transcription antiterminator n=1 Tax=Lactobacillus sp. ESL0677 TaxID=2983208 RepID=UPI0023FA176C|nr:PRD domain-containing protein [Lactobacillus sp. ESL0677]WEV36273.1 PRD domain-containing protein [Lactobacillus sp. ESL0677]
MKNSPRVHELICFLLESNNFITAEEISKKLDVSKKTVYRLVKDINEDSDGPLVISQRGRGFKVNYQFYIQLSSHSDIIDNSMTNISPVERRNRIIKQLLLVSPQGIKESEVFDKYFISLNVRLNDKRIIKSILKEYEIILISKNGYIAAKGSEVNIRHALTELIDDREIIDLNQFLKSSDFSQKYDVRFALREIDKIESVLQTSLPYPYNVNLFSHLYILIIRLRKSSSLSVESFIKDQKSIKLYPKIYQISQQVVKDISGYLNMEVPEKETEYIFEYLISSRFENDVSVVKVSRLVSNVTQKLIAIVSKKMDFDFSFIQLRLEKHIQPLVNRLTRNIHINNNLLEQIKMEYKNLFLIIFAASKKVFAKYGLNNIDENEIGYITLYFAQALEENPLTLKIIIMCATGIGTSELLRIKVKKAFPNLDILDVTSSNNYKYDFSKVDLLISTVKVSDKIKIPKVIVSALFTKKDQRIVQEKIDQLMKAK